MTQTLKRVREDEDEDEAYGRTEAAKRLRRDCKGSAKHSKVTPKVHPERIRAVKEGSAGQGPVIYWMRRDQRVADNWALLYAAESAAKLKAGLIVVYNLAPSQNFGSNHRQLRFVLKGLEELDRNLNLLGIPFHILQEDRGVSVALFVQKKNAALLITDFSPLRPDKESRQEVAEGITVPFHEVDAHNVVPCWLASSKREYDARTFRPKIMRQLPSFLVQYPSVNYLRNSSIFSQPILQGSPAINWEEIIAAVPHETRASSNVDWCQPGEDAAQSALLDFLHSNRLSRYDIDRQDPSLPLGISNLSPYLHSGQLSAQRVALEVAQYRRSHKIAVDRFLEQLVVRRELADNFCDYTNNYNTIDCASNWARMTLLAHQQDRREYLYSRDQLEFGQTHDPLWNAAHSEMIHKGKMHSFLRLYWAKKLLEWTENAQEAINMSIYFNDKYSIDGYDPCGYVGILWSILGVHDRAWAERPVFGKIRYMGFKGCRSKFNFEAYLEYVKTLL